MAPYITITFSDFSRIRQLSPELRLNSLKHQVSRLQSPATRVIHQHQQWMTATELCVPSSTQLPAIAQTDRHSPNKHHLSVTRWMKVGSGGQFHSSAWPHYPATRIQPTHTLLGTAELLPDQIRPLHILSKEEGPCSNWHVLLWQMPNNVTYCQQLSTVQAGGGCSDCTQLITLLPNGWRYTARKCTWHRQHRAACL